MRILLPVLAALVPAALFPDLSFYFDITPKIVLLLTGTALLLLFWKPSLPQWPKWRRWMMSLLGLQFVWMAIATAVSTHPALSLNGGNWRRLGLISYTAVLTYSILVIVDCSGRPDRITGYLRAIAIAGMPISLYGIAQYFGFDPWLDPAGYHAGEGPFTIVRPPSTLGHSNYFGAYLVYVVFAAVALTRISESRLSKTLAITSGVAASMAILFSGTRAAMVGLGVGTLILAIRRPPWKIGRSLQAAGFAVAALIMLFVSPAGQGLRTRLHWSLEEPLGGARPLLWRDTIAMASYRLAAGYGPETFGTEFPKYQSISLSRAYPDFQHESPHNVFLDSLVAQGIPGLLLLRWHRGVDVIPGFLHSGKPGYLASTWRGFGRWPGSAAVQRLYVAYSPLLLLNDGNDHRLLHASFDTEAGPCVDENSSRPLRNRFCGLRRTVDRSGSSAFAYPKRRYQRRRRTGARALSDRSRSGIRKGPRRTSIYRANWQTGSGSHPTSGSNCRHGRLRFVPPSEP